MTSEAEGVSLSLGGLLGGSMERVRARLGAAVTDRGSGGDRWLLFRPGDLSVRLRCRPSGGAWRVASWTVSFPRGVTSLRTAAERVGLWPACAPDERAPFRNPLLLRPLPDPGEDAVHSLTATVRDGLIVALTAFDEAPEWLPEAGRPSPEGRVPSPEDDAPEGGGG